MTIPPALASRRFAPATLALLLSLLLLTVLLSAAPRNAGAQTYGYAYNNIFGLVVSNSGLIGVIDAADASRATATLDGTSIITGSAGLIDAEQAAVGAVGAGQNSFLQQGGGGLSFARGDSQIVSRQFPLPPSGPSSVQAVSLAEINLGGSGTADASATNGSSTGVAVFFSVGSPGAVLRFAFRANPYLQVELGQLAPGGSAVTANLNTSFSLTDSTGQTVFNWSPDGSLGSGIQGGTEVADGANLNTSLASNYLTRGATFTYDPALCGPQDGAASTACGGQFGAYTDPLGPGDYTLTLATGASVTAASLIPVVPEPASGVLLLGGLGMLALLRSRRHA